MPALYTLCNFCEIVNLLILPRFGLWSSSVAAIKRDVLSLQCCAWQQGGGGGALSLW